jgi:hypothetical protein
MYMAENGGNSLTWLEMARNGWKWLGWLHIA